MQSPPKKYAHIISLFSPFPGRGSRCKFRCSLRYLFASIASPAGSYAALRGILAHLAIGVEQIQLEIVYVTPKVLDVVLSTVEKVACASMVPALEELNSPTSPSVVFASLVANWAVALQ